MTIPHVHLARLQTLSDHYGIATSEMMRRMIDREFGSLFPGHRGSPADAPSAAPLAD